MKFRNQEGKISDAPSGWGSPRDDIILDLDSLTEVLTNHFKNFYNHVHAPTVKVTILEEEKDLLIEVEFSKDEDEIPF